MDPFADRMTARGPTLAADRDTWTGSLHIVDLPDPSAARDFVEREPYNRDGMFASHVVARFENLLGRTMWEFPVDSAEPRFLVIAHRRDAASEGVAFADLPRRRLIVHGQLSTLDEGTPTGVALALQAPSRQVVEALLGAARADPADLDLEIHDWEFGGRR
jgi:hypothetical protein